MLNSARQWYTEAGIDFLSPNILGSACKCSIVEARLKCLALGKSGRENRQSSSGGHVPEPVTAIINIGIEPGLMCIYAHRFASEA